MSLEHRDENDDNVVGSVLPKLEPCDNPVDVKPNIEQLAKKGPIGKLFPRLNCDENTRKVSETFHCYTCMKQAQDYVISSTCSLALVVVFRFQKERR